ncbi:hypothetical protein [Sorangium sp. So ce406]|uniref:hypothetical protein n=1 Tax=Sorangium sp. So ce406 TaxID=3133311 RepID=UPI003F5AE47F
MPEGVNAIVLCEDLQAWVFARRALLKLGYDARRIRVIQYPRDGRGGAGEQHVRERYPDELKAYRSRAARMKMALIVHVDADTITVRDRLDALERELRQRDVAPRAQDEAVALLVPKRNIETWIHFFLGGGPVNEETVYPKFDEHESDTWPAAEAFAAHARAGSAPAGAPPSLMNGLTEARRIV